jgi:beta-glucosidase-like glycosyl hydrolase
VWRVKGEILSTEMRAFNNINGVRGTDDKKSAFIGLRGFGPDINMARDPRWGRNCEVPGEDPFLSGQYAVHFVRGMQEGEDPRYLKMVRQINIWPSETPLLPV